MQAREPGRIPKLQIDRTGGGKRWQNSVNINLFNTASQHILLFTLTSAEVISAPLPISL